MGGGNSCIIACGRQAGAPRAQHRESDIATKGRYVGRYSDQESLYRGALVPSDFGVAIQGISLLRRSL